MINSSIKIFLNQKWYPLLKDSLTTVKCNVDHMYLKDPSARKPLCQFSELLNVKQETDFLRLCDAKSNLKASITCHILWSIIPKRRGH